MVLVFLCVCFYALYVEAVLRGHACVAKTPIKINAPPTNVAWAGTSDNTIQAKAGANTTSRMLSSEVSAAGKRLTPSVRVIEAMAKANPNATITKISENEFENGAPNTKANGIRRSDERADGPAAGVLGYLRYMTNPIAKASTIQQARRSPVKCIPPNEPPTIMATPISENMLASKTARPAR